MVTVDELTSFMRWSIGSLLRLRISVHSIFRQSLYGSRVWSLIPRLSMFLRNTIGLGYGTFWAVNFLCTSDSLLAILFFDLIYRRCSGCLSRRLPGLCLPSEG